MTKPDPTPTPTPTPATAAPAYTGDSTADAKCTPTSISKTAYLNASATLRTSLIVPLQCLLKQQHLYRYEVTGKWNTQTLSALQRVPDGRRPQGRSYVSRNHWVAMLVTRATAARRCGPVRSGPDVTRVQRALNAAGSPALKVNGSTAPATQRAVVAYQRSLGHHRGLAAPTWRPCDRAAARGSVGRLRRSGARPGRRSRW